MISGQIAFLVLTPAIRTHVPIAEKERRIRQMGFGVVVFDKIDRAFDRNDAMRRQFGAQAGKAANAPAVGRDRIAK